MKKTLILLISLGLVSLGFAAEIKLGYVNTDRLLLESNEAAEISRLFNLDKQNWTNQVKQLDDEIKQMERNFEIDKLTKTEAAKRDAQTRIDAKKAEAGRLLEEYFGEGGKAEQRYRELIDPLTLKIHNLIMKTAEDEKYTMIFDVSMGMVLYALPALDLTEQILLELNKDTLAPTDGGLLQNEVEPEDPFKTEEPKQEDFPEFKP
ncbi:MAG: OmpH family outer membrane protein [Candidatus Cloacimonetes bacterium]|jgi:outer membrane protein|nr:OmpH family outer membrane protein [Candidatus Cloacimonadota bacterium]MDD3142633.1 OmpH family outer membrane protein [Candidatus Cloacimonadota bacterium]MDY0367917.1 OmpH family outer membrane protein [Candidatus Syntrophosphaera sp.]HOY83809.1 OmpH family outer membrane protein [Candidatus Syntrophosphaera sp.]HPH60023.1 OmpH family outer membrane protein [Candidatus Syntrophosphaera sp.]